jgi:hypothetical protein
MPNHTVTSTIRRTAALALLAAALGAGAVGGATAAGSEASGPAPAFTLATLNGDSATLS